MDGRKLTVSKSTAGFLPWMVIEEREDYARMVKALRKIGDAQPLPPMFAFTGTEDGLEDLFDLGLRHKANKPYDYLKAWLNMARPFAFATQDGSWGELEKLLCIVFRNYVRTLKNAEAAREILASLEVREDG